MAYVVTVEGEIHGIGYKPDLETMQKAVGGLIERVQAGDVVLYVNEEGLLHGLPPNQSINKALGVSLVGDVIVMEDGDEEG
jgi:hypothetical protein